MTALEEGSTDTYIPDVVLIPHAAVGEAVLCMGRAELYSLLGYQVFVDPACELRKNPEAYELLVTNNPFVIGEREATHRDIWDGVGFVPAGGARVDYVPGILKPRYFSPDERRLKIHYRPKVRKTLESVVLLDLNISSYRLRPNGRDDFSRVAEYVRENYANAVALRRNVYDVPDRSFEILPVAEEFPFIYYSTIYEYCDIVASCRKVACLQTGSQYLSACFSKRVECLRTERYFADIANRSKLLYVDCEVEDVLLL